MDTTLQSTLQHPISCTGIGLHTGAAVSMTLHPALADTGVTFRRTDVAAAAADVPGRWENLSSAELCTTIANAAGTTVGTIEHLMAALAGCAVDNVLVELDGPEVPIMDGSADPFVLLAECAGMVQQDAPRRVIRVLREVAVFDGLRRVSIAPDDDFVVDVAIEFDSPAVARQRCEFRSHDASFKEDFGRARTFGFAEEAVALRSRGLARGGSLENAVVVDGAEVLNAGGLRYEDEFVRHKVLDCIGDMYLAGGPMLARVTGVRSGHALYHRLLRALFAEPDAWAMEDAMPASQRPEAELVAAAVSA